MGLDLRIPLGLMFLTIGGIMTLYGAFTWNDAMYARSLGANVNVLWGGAMLLFGGIMFLLGNRARRMERRLPAKPTAAIGTVRHSSH